MRTRFALAVFLAFRPAMAQAPASIKPVEIKTGELRIVGGSFIRTPSVKPVDVTTGELRIVGGPLLPTPRPFSPTTIDTSPLRVSGPAPAPKK